LKRFTNTQELALKAKIYTADPYLVSDTLEKQSAIRCIFQAFSVRKVFGTWKEKEGDS
jgi:hypothetical protein